MHRAEHWVVVRGAAEVTLGNAVRTVHENESIYIPIGSVHRLKNPGKILLELIEVQTDSILGKTISCVWKMLTAEDEAWARSVP
jgi:mannose-1-phosphate guanylyltransferase / mannose-6-phosphate isomerase